MAQKELIQINLAQVLEAKLGEKARYVPRFLVRWLERTVCQDGLNEKLRRLYPHQDAEFCHAAVKDFNVSVEVKNPENFPPYNQRRVIIVCNHPLGGLDGIILISELSKLYGNGVKAIVNDILMAVDPMAGVFLPINKHGRQSRQSIEDINQAMEGDDPILIFPAGLVSRRGAKGEVRDLQWHKMFVAKAIQYHRDVLPLYFSGLNSDFFYSVAQWRKRLGIKFNIEMIYLPREALRAQDKSFSITVGKLVSWTVLAEGDDQLATAQEIKEMTYQMK